MLMPDSSLISRCDIYNKWIKHHTYSRSRLSNVDMLVDDVVEDECDEESSSAEALSAPVGDQRKSLSFGKSLKLEACEA